MCCCFFWEDDDDDDGGVGEDDDDDDDVAGGFLDRGLSFVVLLAFAPPRLVGLPGPDRALAYNGCCKVVGRLWSTTKMVD